MSPVICTSRMKVLVLAHLLPGACQVVPLSVEKVTTRAPCANIEVVPGNVHPSKEWRGWVVVGPARLPVVAAAGVNAEMGPASWVLRSGGLVPAQACSPPFPSEPDREPSLGRLVVQNNRIAKGIGEGAVTAGRW